MLNVTGYVSQLLKFVFRALLEKHSNSINTPPQIPAAHSKERWAAMFPS